MIFVLQLCRVYEEGQFLFNRGYLYVCIISNASQLWALYCLIKFYVATKEELAMYAPIGWYQYPLTPLLTLIYLLHYKPLSICLFTTRTL